MENNAKYNENVYSGDERRKDFCPVHHLKCHQIRDVEIKTSKRVPIWVFLIFVASLTGILGFLNYDSIRRHDDVVRSLENHVDNSNIVLENSNQVLNRLIHSLNEVALNQREVMEKLNLKFKRIPKYEDN